jgi:hypothetical protein
MTVHSIAKLLFLLPPPRIGRAFALPLCLIRRIVHYTLVPFLIPFCVCFVNLRAGAAADDEQEGLLQTLLSRLCTKLRRVSVERE